MINLNLKQINYQNKFIVLNYLFFFLSYFALKKLEFIFFNSEVNYIVNMIPIRLIYFLKFNSSKFIPVGANLISLSLIRKISKSTQNDKIRLISSSNSKKNLTRFIER